MPVPSLRIGCLRHQVLLYRKQCSPIGAERIGDPTPTLPYSDHQHVVVHRRLLSEFSAHSWAARREIERRIRAHRSAHAVVEILHCSELHCSEASQVRVVIADWFCGLAGCIWWSEWWSRCFTSRGKTSFLITRGNSELSAFLQILLAQIQSPYSFIAPRKWNTSQLLARAHSTIQTAIPASCSRSAKTQLNCKRLHHLLRTPRGVRWSTFIMM